MEVKLGLEFGDIRSSLITSSSVFGLCIGSISTSYMVSHGRRRLIIISGFFAMAATVLTLALNIWAIVIGRLVFGICTGVFMTVGPRMLDECVPFELIDAFGAYTNIYYNFGIMLCLLIGAGLP